MSSKRTRTEYILIDTGKCKACWDCIDECKHDTLGKLNFWIHKHVIIKNAENCCGCKKCIEVCPNGVFKSVDQIRTVVNY